MQDDKIVEMFMEIKQFMGEVKKTLEVIPIHEKRICALEATPGKKWNTLTTALIVGAVSFVSGGLSAVIVDALIK